MTQDSKSNLRFAAAINHDQRSVFLWEADPVHLRVAKRVFAQRVGYSLIMGTRLTARNKTAGEIRFVKDQGPEERDIPSDFTFNAKYVKPLANVMWSLSCAMGHAVSAQSKFTKIKAVNVSPDGRLGGKGYIQKITDIRTNLADAIEKVSNTIDTLHDEINGDHWKPSIEALPEKDQDEVEEMVQDSEDILEDPEGYDESEYSKEVEDEAGSLDDAE